MTLNNTQSEQNTQSDRTYHHRPYLCPLQVQSQNALQRCCKLQIGNQKRKAGQIFFVIEVFFSIINYTIAVSAQPSNCMDKKFDNLFFGLRNCFEFTFYYDVALIIVTILGAILFSLKCIKNKSFEYTTDWVLLLSGIKLVRSGLIQIKLLCQGISLYCSGNIFASAIITAILHYLQILMIVIA